MTNERQDVAAFLRDLRGMRVEDAEAKGRAAGYQVETFWPDDTKVKSANLDLNRLTLSCDREGIVGTASTG